MSLAHVWGRHNGRMWPEMKRGGLLVLIWNTRGSTRYGKENKDALMPD